MAKTLTLEETVTPVAEAPAAEEKLTILINKQLGEGENSLLIFADLEYVLGDIDDYTAKLKDARGIPQDINAILPDDPVLTEIEKLPEIAALPEKTRSEQEAKNRAVFDAIRSYYTAASSEAYNNAIMLALTTENTLENEPKPYEKPIIRNRPGLITLNPRPRNLNNPVERRFKQVLDKVVSIPGALNELQEAITLMSIDMRRRLAVRDKDKFRT